MTYRAIAIILAGFTTIFAAFGIRYSYGVLLPEILASLVISKTQAESSTHPIFSSAP